MSTGLARMSAMLSRKMTSLVEAIELHKEPCLYPYLARQLLDGEIWTAHGGVNPQWFSYSTGRSIRLRTRRSHTSARNTENTASLYWFEPPESNTLCLVVGVDCLRIAYEYKGSPCPPYIGQRMRSVPRLLVGYDQETKSTLHILPYPVDLLWAKSIEVLYCTPSLEVVMN
jgi:hypothetical protein